MKETPIDRRGWIISGLAGSAVLLVAIAEALIGIHAHSFFVRGALIPVVILTAVAVGVCRRWPEAALALAWLLFVYQSFESVPMLLTQVTLAGVVFGAARWGGRSATVFAAVFVPMAGLLAAEADRAGVLAAERSRLYSAVPVMAVFAVCWGAGLALRRLGDRADRAVAAQSAAEEDATLAHRETREARQIARLREEQAQLARDVHDVVGHSLAVILAQAESAQFITEPAPLRDSMADIATLARSSLRDVRRVLTAAPAQPEPPGELHTLIDGVRGSGHEITLSETGTTRTLAPELATVAYRVLQEMLTNAIRHGTGPTTVEVDWADELRIRTRNPVGDAIAAEPGGHGLEGMRQRLEAIAGDLEVHRQPAESAAGTATFIATARMPIRRYTL
ncbi:sensor histidine kinase [Nocardia sp. NPDC052566]|uniref:sensor histidine kinase n=1 Tax=Nocardia sp. NPDC052566 TaxID=3364330 RepID=UPI0037CAFCC5